MSKKGGMQYMPKISFPRRWLTQGDNHNFKGSPQECWVWAPQQALQTKNPTLGRQVFKPSGVGVQWGLHMGESEGYRIKMSLLKGAWKISVALSETAQFSSVQLLIRVRLFATPWIATRQASPFIINSRSSLKHVHRVGDAIQPSHPLSSPSPPAPSPSQHQSFPMSLWGSTETVIWEKTGSDPHA